MVFSPQRSPPSILVGTQLAILSYQNMPEYSVEIGLKNKIKNNRKLGYETFFMLNSAEYEIYQTKTC